MSVQHQEAKANIQSFIRQAKVLSDNKVNFDKPFLKSFSVDKECFKLAEQFLGNDMNLLIDAIGVRMYIKEVFGMEALHLFEDDNGELVLDIEHSLLFYYSLLSRNHPKINIALGLVYLIAGHQLEDELGRISKVAPKGRITPKFELDAKLFRWRSCPFILRKYMLQLSKLDGYTAYYFERPNINQIAYLMYTGMSFDMAKNQMSNMQGGLFFPQLPTHIENMLMPSILNGEFDTSAMKGNMTQRYIKDRDLIASEYQLSDVYNVYNQMIKPIMVEIMGMIVKNVVDELSKNPYLSSSDWSVYHLSPQRLGILIKDGVPLHSAMPNVHQFFKPVEQFDLRNILNGDFL